MIEVFHTELFNIRTDFNQKSLTAKPTSEPSYFNTVLY